MSTRATAAKDMVGDKVDEKKHNVSISYAFYSLYLRKKSM